MALSPVGLTEYPKPKVGLNVPAWQRPVDSEENQNKSFVPAWQQNTQVAGTEPKPFLAYTVGGVQPAPAVEGPSKTGEVGQPRRVVDVDGTPVQYTDNRGYVGLTAQVASPLAGGQVGYKEKPGFIPRELCVA